MLNRKAYIVALLVLLPGMTAAMSFSDKVVRDAVNDQESQDSEEFTQRLERRVENRSEASTEDLEKKVKQRLREKTEEMKQREEIKSLERRSEKKRGFLSTLFSIF